MNTINRDINQLLIVSITPYFLEKQAFWFEENLQKILDARHSQSFFEDNIIFLSLTNFGVGEKAKKSHTKVNSPKLVRDEQKGDIVSFSQFLRKLDEMGYEKVFKVAEPGEFSQRGGIIDVFPINMMNAVRLDFLGNEVDSIKLLDIHPVKSAAQSAAVSSETGQFNGVKIDDSQSQDNWWKKSRDILKKRLKSQKLFSELKGLKSGDYLVHLDHGIGQFIGFEEFQISNDKKEKYYILQYAQEDKLYVPVGLERKLSRYIGFHDPKISRLGSSLWQKTKGKVKEEVEKLAKELLHLYAQKETAERAPYIEDKELEEQFILGFAFQETPDQMQAMEDIKNDLAKAKPMDRIVCGDVGFGKTEIAMRAALLAVANNRQTAIMCPTTILANQHFNSFKKRFEKLPVRIALLSRLQTKPDQKKIIKDLEEGKIDIIIGTHKLLSKDIKFNNLQLLIIDDEQKFGVGQKEKLKKIRKTVYCLSLSATPIPRTLYLSLSGIREISNINTPPSGRMAK